MTGSLKESIRVLSDFLHVSHKVLPLSEDYLTLSCETVDGDIIEGEDEVHNETRKFKRLFYNEEIHVDSEIITSIKEADLLVFSVGSLFTSIIPNLLSKDIINAIDESNARILYTCNAVSQPPETVNYTVGDHVAKINSNLGNRKVNAVIAAGEAHLPQEIVDKYISVENKKRVSVDKDYIKSLDCELIESDLLIIENNYIRHDSLKLATCIFNYLMRL